MHFPTHRSRRLRANEQIRNLVCETYLNINNFIMPIFVVHGKNIKQEIKSMPGIYRFSIDKVADEAKEIKDLGINSIILFGIPEKKDAIASSSYDDKGIIQLAIREIKEKVKELLITTDICLCEYMDHGHCGVVKGSEILNDKTLELLSKQALSHVKAGADMVAPSDMMDGRVAKIRADLDNVGFTNTPIMSYAAKFASGFYGPFRDAAESPPSFGDRKTYQMDPANASEAIKEIKQDVEEGADIVMVKPALAYLDIIKLAKQQVNVPIAAYNVSGEYSMIKAAAANGWIDGDSVMFETLTSIKRAGADVIISYFAKEFAKKASV